MHRSHTPIRRTRFALTPVALVAAGMLQGLPAGAQEAPAEAPALRTSPLLRESIPGPQRSQMPTFVEGERITGRTELDTVIEGAAELRRADTVIRADRIDYYQPDDLARARGNVRINRAGDIYEGPQLELKVEAFEGFFNAPRYRFLKTGGWGQASRIDFLDEDHAVISNATYTTCVREPGDNGVPAWQLTADKLEIDNQDESGLARHAVLRFYSVPVLAFPVLSFPLSDKRKSGLLPPTLGVDSVSGTTVTLPWYWNIAPNRDATFSPTYMGRRGTDLGAEFRYLEPQYRGQLRTNYMPDDQLRRRDRWAFGLQHQDALQRAGLPAGTSLKLDLNRVSDDDYWRDFTRNTGSLTSRLLSNDATLGWARGPVSLQVRTLKWQTLQDPTALITPPYDRLPQLAARYSANRLPGGLVAGVEADYTHFRSQASLTGQPNAERSFVAAQLSRPWLTPGIFLTPKLQLHTRAYQFDAPLADGRRSAHVTVPTFSLDSGLVLERETGLFGRDLVQTLEPRAFYVRTPYVAQNFLPKYDTGGTDFNFATIFTENAFNGNDRIADNNLLTLGVTTRLLDAGSSAELARLGVAQRLRLSDQRITLNATDPAVVERLSDLLVGGGVNWTRAWATDGTLQYNPKTGRSERATLGARYNPSPYRVVTAAYRLQRLQSEQVDFGWQWPLNDLWGDRGQDLGAGRGQGGGRWYSVGRINYSMKDRRVVDAILGAEYDGCCYIGRIVLERHQTGTNSSTKRILFQLEFVGLGRLGTNAAGSLKDNIPRYQFLRDQAQSPSRFTQYD